MRAVPDVTRGFHASQDNLVLLRAMVRSSFNALYSMLPIHSVQWCTQVWPKGAAKQSQEVRTQTTPEVSVATVNAWKWLEDVQLALVHSIIIDNRCVP